MFLTKKIAKTYGNRQEISVAKRQSARRVTDFVRIGLMVMVPAALLAQSPSIAERSGEIRAAGANYRLGPGDQLSIWALGASELSAAPVRIDNSGYVDVPMLGRLHPAGQTVEEFRSALVDRLKASLRNPQVTVNITEYRSHAVSVLGSVNKPGVVYLQGPKRLAEVLSLAEGPKTDAGNTVRVARTREQGPLPHPDAKPDSTGQFTVVDLNIADVIGGEGAAANLIVKPEDVITVSRGQLVYVIGEVRKPGGFMLGDKSSVSVLQALSLAEGLTKLASPGKAKILRRTEQEGKRTEVAIDIRRLLSGKAEDLMLRQDDILFIPDNRARNAGLRLAETAATIASGVVIWRVGVPR